MNNKITKERKEYMKEYNNRTEVKAKKKKSQQSPKAKAKAMINREKNKVKARIKSYNQEPKTKAYQKEYRQRPEVKAKTKQYRQTPETRKYMRDYHKTPKARKYLKAYRETYENKIKKNKYRKERKITNPKFRITCLLRNRFGKAIQIYTKTGKVRTSKQYGIDYYAIIEHLKPFPENIIEYHIDHIRPLCSFDLEDPEEIKKAFAPENHQWLLAFDNISKGGKWTNVVLSQKF